MILGIGIGMVISSLILMPFSSPRMSKAEIEQKAREMGMIYREEVKALYENNK